MTAVDGVQRGGFIVFGEGEFARLWSSTVHTTSPEGKEFCQGFVMYDFEDGSSILAKIDIAGEPKTKQVGTIVFLAGSKRFKGISGRGTITSWIPAQWDMYAEVEAILCASVISPLRLRSVRETGPPVAAFGAIDGPASPSCLDGASSRSLVI
jgi:hypothetical protein